MGGTITGEKSSQLPVSYSAHGTLLSTKQLLFKGGKQLLSGVVFPTRPNETNVDQSGNGACSHDFLLTNYG